MTYGELHNNINQITSSQPLGPDLQPIGPKRGPCPFFERCPEFPYAHYHPYLPRVEYEDNLSQTQEFDFIEAFYGKSGMTHEWNRFCMHSAL